jgi:hypothetical protein
MDNGRGYEYSHTLSTASLKALRTILGRSVYQIFTRNLEVSCDMVLASNYSISLHGGPYCVVENDWADMPRVAIDYYSLEASIRDWPKGVGRVRDGSKSPDALAHPSHVLLRTPAAAVTAISVLEHREAADDESVHYDQAIVFTRSDGYRFAFSAHSSILAFLEFTDKPERIDRLLSEFRERVRLC